MEIGPKTGLKNHLTGPEIKNYSENRTGSDRTLKSMDRKYIRNIKKSIYFLV